MLNKLKILEFSEILGFCRFLVRSSSIWSRRLPKSSRRLPQTLGILGLDLWGPPYWAHRALLGSRAGWACWAGPAHLTTRSWVLLAGCLAGWRAGGLAGCCRPEGLGCPVVHVQLDPASIRKSPRSKQRIQEQAPLKGRGRGGRDPSLLGQTKIT